MIRNHSVMNPAQKPNRRVWLRVVGWSAAVIAALLLAIIGRVEQIAHRPSPARLVLTEAEIKAEDAYIKQLGLVVKDGALLKEHPFEAPWTSHSLLGPTSWSNEPGLKRILGPHHLRADLLLADLDVLQPVMERAYGGWDSAANRGWNWSRWFGDWRKQLAAKGSVEISFDEAFAPIDSLIAFQRDNHTQIPLSRWSTINGSETAVLAHAPGAACMEVRAGGRLFPIASDDKGQQIRAAKQWTSGSSGFRDTNYISMPSSYGTPQAVHCGNDWIPLKKIGRRSGNGWSLLLSEMTGSLIHDRARIERLGDGIVYARIPTLIWSNYEQVSRKNWPQRQPGDRVLIVDLRDNGGGSAGYGLDALKDWVDEPRMTPFENTGTELTSSCLYIPLRWNWLIQSGPITLPSEKETLQSMLDRMSEPDPPDCPRTVKINPPKWTYLQRHFNPGPGKMRIIALVNSRCGSDCEFITEKLASLPETIVAGTNTFGLGQYIQPGYSVLPRTGLMYRIALGRSNLYGDNRSFDGYGLDVDVVLPEVDDLKPEQMRELAEVVARQ